MQRDDLTTPGAASWKVGERCPGTEALAMISNKWKASIIVVLGDTPGPLRFAALQRSLRPVSRKVLSEVLHELEADGLVHRVVFAQVPPRVEYSLTTHGERVLPILASLRAWHELRDGEDGLSGQFSVAQPLH